MNYETQRKYGLLRKIGKIYEYDEITGKIMSDDKYYEFSYTGLDEKVSNGDVVSFIINSNFMATDIKKYYYNNSKVLKINKKQE